MGNANFPNESKARTVLMLMKMATGDYAPEGLLKKFENLSMDELRYIERALHAV